jgi:hypothetical protein
MASFYCGCGEAPPQPAGWRQRDACRLIKCAGEDGQVVALVCIENSVRIDHVTESPNVSGDDRAALLLPDPVRLAI